MSSSTTIQKLLNLVLLITVLWLSMFCVIWLKSLYKSTYPQHNNHHHLIVDHPYQEIVDKPFDNCDIPDYEIHLSEIQRGQTSKKVCINRLDLKPKVDKTVQQLKMSCVANKQDGLIAANHGVPIRTGYLFKENTTFHNPVFKSGKNPGYCIIRTESGHVVEVKNRHDEITVDYFDEQYQPQTKTLHREAACIMQTWFRQFKGEVDE